MLTPHWIQKELKLIDEMYFCVYNPFIKERTNMSYGKGRWQIRKWLGVYPKRLDLWDTIYSEPVLVLCQEEYSQECGLYDSGYKQIDMADITAIRKSHWWKLQWKKKLAEIDWRNEMRQRQAEEQLEYRSRYMAKSIWRVRHEPQIYLPGVGWRK